ncbi:MAG TPA: alpha/beta hydrolase [Pyrinomonadaceae bacterium]|jgi:pimeloyl-ACP methyl ester carboxylesterase
MKRLNFTWLLLVLCFAASSALAQAEKQALKSKFADIQGVKVHYNDVGKGKNALVFVHGWTCSADFWRQSVNEFPNYRVIAVDLPGHGISDKPQTDYSMEYFAKSVEAVLKDAGIKKAVLVGHSMGTPVIRQFYRLYPEKTLGLVIVDGALRPMGTKRQEQQYMAFLRADYKANAPKMVDGMLQPINDEKLKQEIRSAMLATPEHVAISAMAGMTDEKIWTNDKINVPVLAIMAESPAWKPDTAEFYRTIAPNLTFIMWAGLSHFLMMERPLIFNQAVRLFVEKNKLL